MENKSNLQEELSSFRQKWQEELAELQQQQCRFQFQLPVQLPDETASSSSSERCGSPQVAAAKATGNEDIENKAKVLFLTGVSFEQKGRMPEAIRYYRQAIQLLPDIESRISDFSELPHKTESSQDFFTEELRDDDDDDEISVVITSMYHSKDLLHVIKEFDKLSVKGICEPEFPTNGTHISALPAELLMYIFKWVVSLRLDLKSLEQLAMVCRGFYVLARDPEIWRLACVRIWGKNLGSPVSWNGCWRKMFLERAHLLYNGVYISKISYVRASEPTFYQEYTPYQLIVYFRYLRFFVDGTVLFLTSPDDPHLSISRLSQKIETQPNVCYGNFRLVGNKVLIVTQKPENVGSSTRKRGRRPVPQNTERVFHVELQLQNTKKRRNSRLTWIQYTCHTFYRPTGQTTVSQFDLNHQFTPFYFSRVKSFEMPTSLPLGLGRP